MKDKFLAKLPVTRELCFFAVIMIFSLSCQKQPVRFEDKLKACDDTAKQLLGENLASAPSGNKEYVLYATKQINKSLPDPNYLTKFVVLQVDENSILHEGSVLRGKVVWYSEEEIKVTYATGLPPDLNSMPQEEGYIYHLINKKRSNLVTNRK